VSIGGEALAFVGPSGRGKSTLAALLCLAGAELITDDVLVVEATDAVVCRGGATELRLRASAAPLAAASPEAATRTTADDRLALTADKALADTLPLRAIVIPAPSRTATQVEHRVVDPSTALFTLLSIPRVYGWRDPDVLRRDFTTLSALVNKVPVLDVVVPWGPPFDPAVGSALARLVESPPAVSDRRAPAARP
jgi:energy-coupling factor transporter ATP-binding protein EcfA2